MKEILSSIQAAGLSEGESETYIALMQRGPSYLAEIQERVDRDRRYLYDLLNKLIEKGLVSYVKDTGRRKYQTTHPRELLRYISDKEERMVETRRKVTAFLPELETAFEDNQPSVQAEILRGKEGIKVLGEALLQVSDNYIIGGSGSVQQYMPVFWKQYNRRREKAGVRWHDLIIRGTLMSEFKKISNAKKTLQEMKLYEYRVLPRELGSPHAITIFGDKVATTLWQAHPFTVVIHNREIARSYLQYFKYLWKDAEEE